MLLPKSLLSSDGHGEGKGFPGIESNVEGYKVPGLRLARNPHVVSLGKSPPFSGFQRPLFLMKRLDTFMLSSLP